MKNALSCPPDPVGKTPTDSTAAAICSDREAVAVSPPPRRSSLSRLRRLMLLIRNGAIDCRRWYLRNILHMDLHPRCRFSLKAVFDFTNPRGIHIGEGTYIAFNAVVFSHDMCRLIHAHTRIGANCFIGAHSIILPGVTIGDQCIIGAGSVVTRDVPAHSVCAGNPARIIKSGIRTREYGILIDAYESVVAREALEDQQAQQLREN